jgi:phosphoglycerol transferase MdoB-like AlkP superfamily enzyme
MSRLPRLFRFLLIASAVGVIALSVMRFAFFLAFNNASDPVPTGDLVHAFYLGVKFDLRLVLIALLPLALFGGLRWLSPFGNAGARWFWSAYLTLAAFAVSLFYVIDFGHYAYLATRVDATVLRFLANADIAAQMVWESYPVLWICLGVAVATLLTAFGIHRLFTNLAAAGAPRLHWPARAATGTVTFVLILAGVYGKVSWYPLRWSDAYFSTHAFAAAVAVNPVHYFFDTRKNGGVRYDEQKVRGHYHAMAEFLGVDRPDPQTLSFERRIPGAAAGPRPNIVVVQIESFASYKTSLSANPLDPTPHFAALARKGLFFPNFFVPHTGTARAVFATTTGTPDVEMNGTSSRNPMIVSQHTLIDEFDGYDKFYFLGGSASWGNIRGLLSHNIPDLRIYEEGSYESPRVDVWGISDLSLFEEANKVLRAQEKPFFAYIQTSGGHRPYTIPEDNRGFEVKHPGDEEVMKYGFISEAEYNSYRFMDHAIGWFMENAGKEKYFANTIFVFFGDHGLGGDAGRHVATTETQLELNYYRVPFVIYAPGRVPPQRLEKVGSQLDILPTVTRIAGEPYRVRTLGRDLLDARYDASRYAFTIDHNQRMIGLISGDGFVFRMGMNGSNPRLYRVDSANPRDNLAGAFPAQAHAMRELTLAIFETSKYALHHNGRTGGQVAHQQTQPQERAQ